MYSTAPDPARVGNSDWPWLLGGWIAALPALAAPIEDPNLWWRLSAGRRVAELGLWPRSEWLSFTLPGVPWLDREWLAQTLFYAVYHATGFIGLWFLKAGLLTSLGVVVMGLLRHSKLSMPICGLALAIWGIAIIPCRDLHPNLFSLIGFSLLLVVLKSYRRNSSMDRLHGPVLAAGFCLWANLHSGFILGLFLLFFYAVWEFVTFIRHPSVSTRKRLDRWVRKLAWAVIGASLGPQGLLAEIRLLDPSFWDVQAIIPCLFVLMVLGILPEDGTNLNRFVPREMRSRLGAVALGTCALFSLGQTLGFGTFRHVSYEPNIPVTTGGFLKQHSEFAGRRLYHPRQWGGYLGWRLYGEYRVFHDGRYLFRDLSRQAFEATSSPESWTNFLNSYGVDVAVLENVPIPIPTTRVYSDGSTRQFRRPYYVAYMPREAWALVHFDENALVFIRRAAFSPTLVAVREYRLLRPHDDEALEDALQRHEVDTGVLDSERARHEKEIEVLSSSYSE